MRALEHAKTRVGDVECEDRIWCARNRFELLPNSFDPALTLIGSSPYLGDAGNVGAVVPAAPTLLQTTRYLFRMVSVAIPLGAALIVHGMRQLVEIGDVNFLTGSSDALCTWPVRLVVTSPTWAFTDGNVSWHMRLTQPLGATQMVDLPVPGTQAGYEGVSGGQGTALLENTLAPYVPPGSGQPPGLPIGDYGTIRSLLGLWNNPDFEWDTFVKGPGRLSVYVSVRQTDPATRCQPVALSTAQMAALGPEDRFIAAFTNARYTRVAASLSAETVPSEFFESKEQVWS
jgi:hypothetical protein